jgi:chromosome segregation ATPase
MATNTTEIMAEHWLEAEGYRPYADRPNGKNGGENGAERETSTLALAPLVDKIAYGFARGLVVALKELENHIASETRKVGESVGRRLDTLQASFQDLTVAVSEQRAMSVVFQEQCQQLEAATVSLREVDARHAEELTAFRTETRESSAVVSGRIDTLCRELGIHQEDIEAVKSTLGEVSTRVDGVVERLDRQADALRSIYSTYAQRETELEQLVDGLARLRSHAAPAPAKPL